MFWCIFWTALATWFFLGMYSVFTTYSFSFDYIGKIFVLAFAYISEFFGYAVGSAIFILFGFLVYLFILYSKQIVDEKIEEKKQEQEEQLQELEEEYNRLAEQKKQEIQQLEVKLNKYKNTLNKVENLQDKIDALFGRLIVESYNFIVSKEKLIEALRQRRAKQIEAALKRGDMTEKSAERARKNFNKLLEKVENSIEQEKELFDLLVGEKWEAIKQLFNQIRGG